MVKIGLSVLKTGGVPILNWNTVLFHTVQNRYRKTFYFDSPTPRNSIRDGSDKMVKFLRDSCMSIH